MRKTRILIASVLKPVNDPRMFAKVGQSLAKPPETEIHIAGFAAKSNSISANIGFHPIFSFPRLSWGRLAAQWNFYKILLQVKPKVIIANTFELLPVSVLYRIFHSTVILYDVRENYYANIRFQPTFPKPLRWILANTVRLIEKTTAPFILHFFLAERSYARELPFIKEKFTILENKFKPAIENQPIRDFPITLRSEVLRFLYSGTFSEVYGIFEAIDLVTKLHQTDSKVILTIIGYCAQPAVLEKVRNTIQDKPFMQLIGGDALVPHSEIMEAIKTADVGLLPYQFNLSTQNCLPTKLFEYLANGLPVLVPFNKEWEQIVLENQAGFAIDFTDPAPENILNRLKAGTFYPNGFPSDVFWDQEETKLLNYFRNNVLNH